MLGFGIGGVAIAAPSVGLHDTIHSQEFSFWVLHKISTIIKLLVLMFDILILSG